MYVIKVWNVENFLGIFRKIRSIWRKLEISKLKGISFFFININCSIFGINEMIEVYCIGFSCNTFSLACLDTRSTETVHCVKNAITNNTETNAKYIPYKIGLSEKKRK